MSVDSEIAGMGKVRIDEAAQEIIVEDVAIYDQEVTNGTADLSSAALASFMTEKIRAGESLKPWILWWHSHVDMSAFFSGIDTGTIESSNEFDHLISLVVNKKGEAKCRIDSYRPFRMTKDNVEVVWGHPSYSIPESIAEEVAQKVKSKSYKAWGWRAGKDEERETWQPRLAGSSAGSSESKNEGGSHPSGLSKNDYLIAKDNPEMLEIDEIETIVDILTEELEAMKKQGRAATQQYKDKVADKVDWIIELSHRERQADQEEDAESIAEVMGDYNGHHS